MNEMITERFALAKERILSICEDTDVKEPFRDFFMKAADFLALIFRVLEEETVSLSEEELKSRNAQLYADISPENYGTSYGNPACAAKLLGQYGQAFCFLYAELRGAIVFAFEKRIWDLTVVMELLLEIYSEFSEGSIPQEKTIRNILVSYINDYCQDMVEYRVRQAVDPSLDFAVKIVMESDLSDLSYLYYYGEYISENETGTAAFLNSLSQEEIDAIARTWTEGYRIGFITTRKDITRKKTVNIRYHVGFERVVRSAIG